MMLQPTLQGAAHIVQLALTPIFLLTGVGQLLNVFMTRVGRIDDRLHAVSTSNDAHPREIAHLQLRSRVLDAAVLLSSTAGILTCCTAMVLFTGAVRNEDAASVLFWLFGAALICTIAALAMSAVETAIATRAIRERADQATRAMEARDRS